MNSDKFWRLGIVAVVALGSLILIIPTFQYFLATSGKVAVSEERKQELQKKSVPLGLDLQGGVDVLLAVDTKRTRQEKVEGYADRLRDRFKSESPAIDANVDVTSGSQSIIVVPHKAEQIRSIDNILAKEKENGIFPDYESGSLKAGEPLTLTVNRELMQNEFANTIESSLKVIRDRVDKLKVTQPVVVQQGTDRIRVQIPGEKDPEQVVKNIIKPAYLEFKGVHTSTTPGPDGAYEDDSGAYIDITTGKPLAGKSIPPGYEVRVMRNVRKNTETGKAESVDQYVLVKRKTEMTGAMLSSAWVTMNANNLQSPVQVQLEFTREGAVRFGEVTSNYIKKPLAVLLDGVVYTKPVVQQKITEGHCEITGGFTQEEARDLSLILKAGALPAELKTVEQRTVEATLGADSISKSVFALGLGSLIVGIYMIFYYGVAGAIALVAVLINILIILAFMKLASATLTLSGIGGILLTVGMAVDANVLIYERIREELKAGKTRKAAIALGFSRAFAVIFDANLTTLISGLVLLQFGEGSVKGFALSLNIGILATLFTGLFCTHALVDVWFAWRKNLGVGKFQWFRDGFFFNFVQLRRFTYIFSLVTSLICILWVLPFKPFPGSNMGVDFTGGLLTEVTTNKELSAQQVQGDHSDWRVQKVLNENKFMIRTKIENEEQPLADTQKMVQARLNETVGAGQFQISGSEAVSNEVGREFTSKAILACIFASIGILIYMAVRFEFIYGFAAVVALVHDVIIAYGVFNILSYFGLAGEVTLDVIAALLVILGYSVNDTIIILDRVRENLKLHPGKAFGDIINMSICDSLNRTLVTVSTVVIVLTVMLIWGGSGLFDFSLVLLMGVVFGTYSSSLMAAPLLYDLHNRQQKKGRSLTGTSANPKVTA